MIIALIFFGHFAVAVLCAYIEGLVTGENDAAPMWLLWPVMVPVFIAVWAFETAGAMGAKRSGK